MNKRKVILNKVFPNASYMTQLGKDCLSKDMKI